MFDWFPLTTKALGKVLFIHVASGEPKLTNTCPNISIDANNHRNSFVPGKSFLVTSHKTQMYLSTYEKAPCIPTIIATANVSCIRKYRPTRKLRGNVSFK